MSEFCADVETARWERAKDVTPGAWVAHTGDRTTVPEQGAFDEVTEVGKDGRQVVVKLAAGEPIVVSPSVKVWVAEPAGEVVASSGEESPAVPEGEPEPAGEGETGDFGAEGEGETRPEGEAPAPGGEIETETVSVPTFHPDPDERERLAREEYAEIQLWKAMGKPGERPATPNLDESNRLYDSGVRMGKARKVKSQRAPREKRVLTGDEFGEGPTGLAIPDRIVRYLIVHDRNNGEGVKIGEIREAIGCTTSTVNRQAWTLGANAPDLQDRLRGWVVSLGKGRYCLSERAQHHLSDHTELIDAANAEWGVPVAA